MKKRTIVLCIGLFVCILLGGIFVRKQQLEKQQLPVIESTALYPNFSFEELLENADYIVEAKVLEVGESVMEEVVAYYDIDFQNPAEVLKYPVTPIQLEVMNCIKGNAVNRLIYYEDGGVTPNYIQLPSGYAMEEGMEVILFLDDSGHAWGSQSIFPVDGEKVLLNAAALEHVNTDAYDIRETSLLTSSYKSQIDSQSVPVMEVEEFVKMLQELLGAKD